MATKAERVAREGSEREGVREEKGGESKARSQWRLGAERVETRETGVTTTADVQLLAHQRCWNAAMLINPGNPRGFSPQKPGWAAPDMFKQAHVNPDGPTGFCRKSFVHFKGPAWSRRCSSKSVILGSHVL